MIKSYDENIGFESILPNEIIELLDFYKSARNKHYPCYELMSANITSLLDEHELAMIE